MKRVVILCLLSLALFSVFAQDGDTVFDPYFEGLMLTHENVRAIEEDEYLVIQSAYFANAYEEKLLSNQAEVIKFSDGPVTCYILENNGANSISCVK